MNKFQKVFKTFQILWKEPSLINLILESDFRWNAQLKKNNNKSALPVVNITELVPDFDETLNLFTFLGGGSLLTDIMLLKALASKIKDCSYFEIGTWRGESVINVSEIAKECYTLNLSKEEIEALGLPEKYAELHGFFSKEKENITHLFGDSMGFDFASLNKKFDLIFIDGNHKYDFVKNDTEKVFKHLVHENSIVVWHDYAYNPESPRPEILLGILDGIPEEYKENLYHVSNTMCAIYSPKQLKNIEPFEYPTTPKKTFTVRATSKNL